ncbi:MAG: NEW3 domain-containing protein [Chloroflexota bacterium]
MTTDQRGSGISAPAPSRSGRSVRPGLRRALTVLFVAALSLGSLAPAAIAAGDDQFSITTPYPAVVAAPGGRVSFNVSVKTSVGARVDLELSGAPASWNPTLHGGGFVISAVETNGTDAGTVRVDLDVPADATGTTRMILKGTADIGGYVELPLEVRIEANATGDVTLKTDFPSLKGPSTQTFNFNLTLANDTPEDLTFSVNAQGPTGWTVQANLTGQSQAASAVVKAGATSGVTVSAVPPVGVAAGSYDFQVVALAGERTIQGTLTVEVTGTYTLSMATADGRLNGHGPAGSASPLAIVLTNTGTADITNVKLTGSAPGKWEVTFDQATVPTIPANQSVTVNAQVKPSGDAIAGDYNLTISANGEPSARDSLDIRYSVETSVLWGVVGVALIVAVAGGVWWVFQRYGRR